MKKTQETWDLGTCPEQSPSEKVRFQKSTPVPRPKSSSSTENGVVGGVWGIGKGGRHMRGSPKAKHKAGEVEVKFDSKRHGRCGNCNRIVPKVMRKGERGRGERQREGDLEKERERVRR
eukprot:1394313-Amorphochlora_amoeboformis.AAC.1